MPRWMTGRTKLHEVGHSLSPDREAAKENPRRDRCLAPAHRSARELCVHDLRIVDKSLGARPDGPTQAVSDRPVLGQGVIQHRNRPGVVIAQRHHELPQSSLTHAFPSRFSNWETG
jgi:hypothetical protein